MRCSPGKRRGRRSPPRSTRDRRPPLEGVLVLIHHRQALWLVTGLLAPSLAIAEPCPETGPSPSQLRAVDVGDLVLRDGSGAWITMAKRLSTRDKRFGHVGIVSRLTNEIQVVHADGDPITRSGRVAEEALSRFLLCAPAWAIYRPRMEVAARNILADSAAQLARQAVPFDGLFSLESDDRVYCTELVWRAWKAAIGHDPLPQKPRFLSFTYIPVDTFTEPSIATLVIGSESPDDRGGN